MTPTEKARELAKSIQSIRSEFSEWKALVPIIAAALESARNEALEDAAKVALGYVGTEANPKTIAEEVLSLKGSKVEGGSNGQPR